MNTATMQNGENIGFAIPISIVNDVIEQIFANSAVIRAWVGASFAPTQTMRFLAMPGVMIMCKNFFCFFFFLYLFSQKKNYSCYSRFTCI